MEEKKNTFEMDDSHFDSIEEIITKPLNLKLAAINEVIVNERSCLTT